MTQDDQAKCRRGRAEETILDQRLFLLDPEAHEIFLAMLDNPAKPREEVRALMKRKPRWEC